MKPSLTFIGVLLVCFSSALRARTLDFAHLTTKHGLSDNSVFCIHQDHQGFIWIGTQNGLNQYDGYRFRIFQQNPSDSTSISSNQINCLLSDVNGGLWIGTDLGGLNRYDREYDRFVHFRNRPDDDRSIPGDFIASLFNDRNGQLWVGTSQGVCRYDRAASEFVRLPFTALVKTIFEDSSGTFWFGTGYQGIFTYSPQTGQIRQYTHNPADPRSLSVNTIETITEDVQHRIWIGTIDGGLNLYDSDIDGFQAFMQQSETPMIGAGNTVYTLVCDRQGNLWAGYENAGLRRVVFVHDKQGNPNITFETFRHDINNIQTLSNNTVRAIFEDSQGNLWIGTYYGGVNLYRRFKKEFHNFYSEPYHDQGLNHNVIQTFLEDRRGNIWIGTDGGGINLLNRASGTFQKLVHDPDRAGSLSDNHVLDFHESSDGRIWVATWNGLNVFSPENRTFRHFFYRENDSAGLISSKVTSVLEDTRKNVWIGTISGLTVLQTDGTFIHFDPEKHLDIGSRYVHAIFQDSRRNIWVATVHGLYFLSYAQQTAGTWIFRQYVHNDADTSSIPVNHILAVYEDSRGFIWLGTTQGLCRYDQVRGHFTHYTVQDGLASNMIFSVIEDQTGLLWMGTNKGITRFDPEQQQCFNFGIHDGLFSDAFTKGVLKSRSGELYFGGKNGFTCFFPPEIRECRFIPPVVLTDFQIFDRSTPVGTVSLPQNDADSLVIDLKYKQNMISFEFSALDFTAPEKNRYRFMLAGFDEGWRETSAGRRFVTYTNLPPGDYIFKVQGSNCDGLWNLKGFSAGVTVNPPFWRTHWAFLLYVLTIFSILMLLRHLIIYRQNLKNEIVMERIEAERIHELDMMKLRFFTNISHEFRTPLTLILGLLERLVAAKGKLRHSDLVQNYHIMQRNARRLLRLINQIMDIRKLDEGRMGLNLKHRDIVQFIRTIYSSFKYQAEQRNIQYSFSSNEDKFFMWFDTDKIDKIVYNLISNAFKYTSSRGSRIHVSIQAPRIERPESLQQMPISPMLEIQVQDTGIGIEDANLEKIFDPFYQVQTSGEGFNRGTGIGLSLTKELVGLHHGHINVESQPDIGSSFKVLLPTNLIPQAAESGAGDFQIEDDLYPVLARTTPVQIDHVLTPENPNAPMLLVVDDDLDFCVYLKDELSSDYRVQIASSGESGYEKALENLPDLIISDVRMPKMDGFTLCRSLKKNEKSSHIPVILLTSQTQEQTQIDGLDCGADDYIVKPFDIHILRKRIANLMESRKRLKERFSHEIYLQPSNVVITSEDERFLLTVFEVVEAHLEDAEYSVSQLGRDVGLSRVQLYRKVKAITELTPNELIKNFRLKRAAQLLKESHLTVFEITYRIGFKDPSYFCKCFKQVYGVSPTEYAKEPASAQEQR